MRYSHKETIFLSLQSGTPISLFKDSILTQNFFQGEQYDAYKKIILKILYEIQHEKDSKEPYEKKLKLLFQSAKNVHDDLTLIFESTKEPASLCEKIDLFFEKKANTLCTELIRYKYNQLHYEQEIISSELSKKTTLQKLKKIKTELVYYCNLIDIHIKINNNSSPHNGFFSKKRGLELKKHIAELLIQFLAIKIHEIKNAEELSKGKIADDEEIRATLKKDSYLFKVKMDIENVLQEYLPTTFSTPHLKKTSDLHYEESKDVEMTQILPA